MGFFNINDSILITSFINPNCLIIHFTTYEVSDFISGNIGLGLENIIKLIYIGMYYDFLLCFVS